MLMNFFSLTEPTLGLVGKLLPPEANTVRPGNAEVLIGPQTVQVYEPATRPVLEYFSRLRELSEARRDLSAMGVDDLDSLDWLVEQGVLWRCNPGDFTATAAALSPWTIRFNRTGTLDETRPGQVVFDLGDERSCVIDQRSAAVFEQAGDRTLGAALDEVGGVDDADSRALLWRVVGADLVSLLRNDVAFVVLPSP